MKISRIYVAILLFFGSFLLLCFIKPRLVYDEWGGFREFGIGYRNKTIIPIWLVTILFAICSYCFAQSIVK